MKTRSHTLDDSSFATNPGGLPLMKWHWLKHYPLWPLMHIAWTVFFVSYLFTTWHWMVFLVGMTIVVGLSLSYWTRVSEHFRMGCTLPGIVLSVRPSVVAVLTDMTKGVGCYPTVKIVHVPLVRTMGKLVRTGDRIAMVALYSGGGGLPHWSNFDPKPAEAANSDRGQIVQLLATIPEDEWNELQQWISRLPSRKRGLYRFHEPAGL